MRSLTPHAPLRRAASLDTPRQGANTANSLQHSRMARLLRQTPALQALLVQAAALLTVLLLCRVLAALYPLLSENPLQLGLLPLVVLHSVLAVGYCRLAGMASWWRWIHALFPLAIWLMAGWQVPSSVYLVGFVVTLSLFWTSFRSQVPFFPSRPQVRTQLASVLPQDKPLRVIDIGSGLGDLAMHIAQVRPQATVTGIEIAPLPWLISKLRGWARRSSAGFALGDYRQLDFADYQVVFAYLSPAAMLALWQQASAQMRPGSLLVSFEFTIPGTTPSYTIPCGDDGKLLYVWQLS